VAGCVVVADGVATAEVGVVAAWPDAGVAAAVLVAVCVTTLAGCACGAFITVMAPPLRPSTNTTTANFAAADLSVYCFSQFHNFML